MLCPVDASQAGRGKRDERHHDRRKEKRKDSATDGRQSNQYRIFSCVSKVHSAELESNESTILSPTKIMPS